MIRKTTISKNTILQQNKKDYDKKLQLFENMQNKITEI